ncbi:MAG TPA: hypothetical protein VGX97_10005 [bacterium]|nr:hypothetical protein [bacterium]
MQDYSKRHNLAAVPDLDTLLLSPGARGEIMAFATGMYRRYLQFIGYRLILSRNGDCTRAIVAFAKNGAIYIVAEELLAQAATGPLEITPGTSYGGPASSPGGGSEPIQLSDSNGQIALDCCSSVSRALATLGLSAWGMTQILLGMNLIGLGPWNTTMTTPGVLFGLGLIGKSLTDVEHAIENAAGVGGPINLTVDAILIPFGLWLVWPEMRRAITPDKQDPFR